MRRLLPRSGTKIFLSTGIVDMRKSINGLAAIVENDFDLDLYDDVMFMFVNGAKDKVKILHWDKDGFILYYKRREKGHFAWPEHMKDGKVNEVSLSDVERFLEGLTMEAYMEKPHFRVT